MAEWGGVRGKRILMTGATGGIGLAAAEALAMRGAHLTLVARSAERARSAVERLRATAGAEAVVDVLDADLASLSSVRRLAGEVLDRSSKLHVLINNAGAINATRQLSEDGIELTWAVNHLAPF